jgi:hypothetical protein
MQIQMNLPFVRLRARFSQFLPVVLGLLLGAAGYSQVTSSIQGRVADSSGAAVANVAVRATNQATGLTRTVQSSDDGYYRVPDLLPGLYEIRIEHKGFRALMRRDIEVVSQSTLNIDLALQVGELTQTVDVTSTVPQIETTESRISSVVGTTEIRSLPQIGRGLMYLTMLTPGVQGKAEDSRSGICCDSLQANGAPTINAAGNDNKAVFFVDGIALHYGDGNGWGLAFTPNPDAVEEMRVSSNPTSAEDGIISGAQVQMVTKGGSNGYHGTAHYTFLNDTINALPYGASKADVGSWYQRFYGGTFGGKIIRDRLFFFGAYEGLQERRAAAAGGTALVETEAFKNWVTKTSPNSVAAKLLTDFAPFKYPTTNLQDLNGDGTPDVGTIPLDRPADREGYQFNTRIDYLSKSSKDRIYATYWDSNPKLGGTDARPKLDNSNNIPSWMGSIVHTRSFSPNTLNDLRVAMWNLTWDYHITGKPYHIPCVSTDDGLGIGPCNYSYERQDVRTYDVRDTFSITTGRHTFKFGGAYRQAYLSDPAFLTGDIPAYSFANVFDFGTDKPYSETRAIDAATGKQRDPFVEAKSKQLSFFMQNSWQIRQGLVLNYGLRWDNYFNFNMGGFSKPTTLLQPLYTSSQVNAAGVRGMINKVASQSYASDKNNLGPRISVAWDPWKNGKNVIRGGFFMLYDEIGSLGPYRDYYANPPRSSVVSAGPEYGIPIVYGIAPEGTRDFPVNPGLASPAVDPAFGKFAGTRPAIAGFPTDFRVPLTYDVNAAYERQIFEDLALTFAYHYRRTGNERIGYDANRINGDLVDGRFDRNNPEYDSINVRTNEALRVFHGLSLTARKRLSNGFQIQGSYGYNNARDNFGGNNVFDLAYDWARVEGATHTFKAYTIWDLPILRGSSSWAGKLLGGWQLNTIWNLESGGRFNPTTRGGYGSGGDFNADGVRNDRPDRPQGDVPTSFSKDEWMKGAMSASLFPLPTGAVRPGNLPRNYFEAPGYARIDLSFAKSFGLWESGRLRFDVQASNILNRVNIRGVQSNMGAGNFAQATSFYPMRAVQIGLKLIF